VLEVSHVVIFCFVLFCFLCVFFVFCFLLFVCLKLKSVEAVMKEIQGQGKSDGLQHSDQKAAPFSHDGPGGKSGCGGGCGGGGGVGGGGSEKFKMMYMLLYRSLSE